MIDFDSCLECGEDTERFTKCPRCNLQVCPVCADDGHGDCIPAETCGWSIKLGGRICVLPKGHAGFHDDAGNRRHWADIYR